MTEAENLILKSLQTHLCQQIILETHGRTSERQMQQELKAQNFG